MTLDALFADRVGITIAELAAAAGYSRDFIRLEIKRGRLTTFGTGRQRRIYVESARVWFAALDVASAGPPAHMGFAVTRKGATA